MSNKRYTILHVNPFSFDNKVGGVDTAIMRLIHKLDPTRYRSIVAIPAQGPLVDDYEKIADQVKIIPINPIIRTYNPFILTKIIFGFFISVWKLYRLIKAEEVDIVHTQMILVLTADIAARLAGVPCVHTVNSIWASPNEEVLWQLLARIVYRLANIVQVRSNDIASMYIDEKGDLLKKVVLIHDGVDTEIFHPQNSGLEFREDIGIDKNNILVGTVARLHPQKGIESFLEAAQVVLHKRPDVRFVIVGDVSLESQIDYKVFLIEYAKDLGIYEKVIFTGARSDVPHVMAGLDIFVLASVREAFGIVLIEAMATGKPVVATAAGGPLDIVDNNVTGLLVPPNDSTALAKAIVKLSDNLDLREKMGIAGRRRVEKLFSLDTEVYKTVQGYEALLGINR